MAFVRLENEHGEPIAPSEGDLAFFTPRGKLHGFSRLVPPHVRYWRKQLADAKNNVDIARWNMARNLLVWLTLESLIRPEQSPEVFLGRLPAPKEAKEGWRRTVLGGLAMSMMLRSDAVIDIEQPLIDARGMARDAAIHSILDLSIEPPGTREWPYEPRLHLRLQKDTLPPDAGVRDMWYWQDRHIIDRRYPGDLTPPMLATMQARDLEFEPTRYVTFIPHLAALDSPLLSSS